MTTITIASSRFNNETWTENAKYRKENNLNGGIYCAPLQMSVKIPLNSLVFIVEMNNTINKIEGVGLIRNYVQFDKNYRVYQIQNYHRYIYKGEYRIDRSVLERYNPHLVKVFDHILFKEKTHMKRGSGLTTVPKKLLNHDICQGIDLNAELCKIFKQYFGNA